MSTNKYFLASATTVAASSVFGIFLYCYYKNLKNKLPEKWKKVGAVQQLLMYPIKSGRYVQLTEFECLETGAREITDGKRYALSDRCFILFTSDFQKHSTLKNKKSLLISVSSVDEDTLILKAPEMNDMHMKISQLMTKPNIITIKCDFDTHVEAVDCGDKVSIWLSKYMCGDVTGYRMGWYLDGVTKRPNKTETLAGQSADAVKMYKNFKMADGGLYTWLSSYLVMNEASLDDLNSKLSVEDTASIYNFRPNIVIGNARKYEEDDWEWIKIGNDVILRFNKPCTRYRRLKHLKGYDFEGDRPVLGVYMGLYSGGKIKIGDDVYVPDK